MPRIVTRWRVIKIRISTDRVQQHVKRLHDDDYDDIIAKDMSTAMIQRKHGKKNLLKKTNKARCDDKNS